MQQESINIFEKLEKENKESKENILATLEKIDFGSLTPEKSREKTLMIKVDVEVYKLFKDIARRKGRSMKALGNWCILDFLERCKREEI